MRDVQRVKPVVMLDLASVFCLLDGESVESEQVIIHPADDLLKAHDRSVALRDLRCPEPEFHL